MCPTRKPPCTSRTAVSSSPTASTRCARCATVTSSTRRATWRGSARSLAELQIAQPMRAAALAHVMRQVIRRNRVRNGLVYLQVTRGAGPREFYFPDADVTPTVVCLARSVSPARLEASAAVGIVSQVDARHPLAALRHQDGDAAAGLPRQGGRAPGRRARGLVRRQGRLRHRRGFEQCLDRRCVGRCHHAADWGWISCPA